MKVRNWSLVFILVLTFGVFLPMHAQNAAAKPVQISFSNLFPHLHSQTYEAWGNEIEKRTGGKVKFVYYHGGTLLKGAKIYDGILKGITDAGSSVLGYSRGVFPALESIELPMAYKSGYQATMVINDFIKIYKLKALSKVKVLYMHAHGPGLLHSKTPIYTMDDVKGLKIRSYGFNAGIAKNLGGVPVAMPQPGVYEALQKGVVDASLSPYEVLYGWKQAEVIKATTESYSVGYTSGFFVFMNLAKWNSLPGDVQKIIDEVSAQWPAKQGRVWDKLDKMGKDFTLKKGNKVITLSPEESARWANAVKPVVADYIKSRSAKGLPAADYVKTVRELVKKHQP
ncbi:MAG: TRAP transporter substrate-binding protein [Deltaproteobacteria bacterium]|nr:TRAP transporter substrate-binding protein [Deltaproteobacteria bacterium]